MRQQRFIQETELLEDSYRLAVDIFNDGFRPTFVVGLWRGGSTVGIYVQECLQYLGVETDHIALRTSYRGMHDYEVMVSNPDRNIRVHGTQYLLETLNAEDRLLIVDDVSGSGQTLDVVRKRLAHKLKRNLPNELRTATLFHKPGRNRSGRRPDYFRHETDEWLVLPYELVGLDIDTLRAHKPDAAALLQPDLVSTVE
ncbi:MAG: phosphoribosyltransferase family protein [Pseudomonadota bacterium]